MSVRPKDDPLARELRRLRLKLGMTQQDFCGHFHINRSTLSTWESNGPPARGPTRAFVIATMARLRKGKRERKKASQHGNLGIGRRGRDHDAGDTAGEA